MTSYSGAQLASALHGLEVDFVLSEEDTANSLKDEPLHLIVALAESEEARLRLSLIPLFLQHPEYSTYVHDAAKITSGNARLFLQCYYTASVWLQQKYRKRLVTLIGERPALHDLFSKELMILVEQNPDKNLQTLAYRHQELSMRHINWLGTYQHGVERFMTHLERKKTWQS